jgi:hypothetical protein
MDSYVMFGDVRVCDYPGHWDPLLFGPLPPKITSETIALSYRGTLNNYDSVHDTWDGYIKSGTSFLTENLTVDLLHLVLPDSTYHTISLKLCTRTGDDFMTVTEYDLSTTIYSPFDGDTDKDGDVDLTDLAHFARGWYRLEPVSWAVGDFDADGDVDLTDLSAFRPPWWCESEQAASVPEPSLALILALDPFHPPVNCDTDRDGDIDLTDLANFATGWYGTAPASWATGDFDEDGDVDLTDLSSFANCWHFEGEQAASVPEPGSAVMLALGALSLAGWRLRKPHKLS